MTGHLLLAIVSLAADGTEVMPNAWDGAAGRSPYGYGDIIGALLPVAIVCTISLLCTVLWLLATGAHLRSRAELKKSLPR
jgi:hypothetical protein